MRESVSREFAAEKWLQTRMRLVVHFESTTARIRLPIWYGMTCQASTYKTHYSLR